MIIPVILCGGSGTRLWPLSRKSLPKQFAPILGEKNLLGMTLERVKGLGDQVVCVAAEEHRFLINESLESAGLQGQVILEPVARNTAAAIALAALSSAPQDLLLICPADHHIPDVSLFAATIEQGAAAALEGNIVTFGVVPTFPSTAYGYIQPHPDAQFRPSTKRVARFIEKPDMAMAAELLAQGNVLWNAGIFLSQAKVLLAAMEQHAPDILEMCSSAMEAGTRDTGDRCRFIRPEPKAFASCRSESIDYAVLEQADNVAVVPFQGQWSDVGSWNAVAQLFPADADGNRIQGRGVALKARQTFIHAPERAVVALGTRNLLIIDTPDALLVADAKQAEQVKQVVAELESRRLPQASQHKRVARPWGWYESMDAGERFQVKRIVVKPNASLSLQKHFHRAEHWVVVKGTAEVTCGEKTFLLGENQSTYIPVGEVHRLRNPGKMNLELVEVQSGSYLGEDDIVRLDDHYGRTGQQ